ncbi:hypothetical protein [Dysgonomonas sp. GY617]|uniref:hypothetical protein n=1 Tax=Dysgonomonas sp. GY617 TaxID=2780420 RepID=UPI0018835B32|nr:hypothetical protein [Dysgonomonas sp. GY617]MBF0575924.1 hypothetical protein [Dysgonomonas sp. GY617]
MKKRHLLALVWLSVSLFFTSCENEEIITSQVSDEPALRSLHPSGFENNWETQTQIKITQLPTPVDLPWVPSAPTAIPLDKRTDIKKQDGWNFLSTASKEEGTDYLIFYNKYTGVLKIFYYSVSKVLNNNVIWQLLDENKCGYFNQGPYFTTPMSDVRQQFIGVAALEAGGTNGLQQGWNCFELPVTYTPLKGKLNVYSKSLNISKVELTGNYTETTKGTIVTDHSSTTEGKYAKEGASIAKAGGDAAESWLKKVATKSKDIPKEGIFKGIPNVVASLASGGVTSLISSGLNALFGSFLGSKTVSQPVIQTVELTTSGQITTTGTITGDLVGIVKPLTNIDASIMGAWNLRTAPKLTASAEHFVGQPRSGTLKAFEYYQVAFYPSIDLVVNPLISSEVECKVDTKIVEYVGPKWNEIFEQYSTRKYTGQNYREVQYGSKTYYAGAIHPELYHDEKGENKTILRPGAAYALGLGSWGDYVVPASSYASNYTDYTSQGFSNCNGVSRVMLSKLPLILSNCTINGKPSIYPGNYAVNVTVTMKVKATGQEIVSSRTYVPEYVCNF